MIDGKQFAEDILAKLIPDLGSFLIQLAALIVLLIVGILFAYKPVKKMLAKRQNYIEENILEAEKSKANAIIAEREANQLIIEKKKEAELIIANAVMTAKNKSDAIIDSANQELILMKEKAREELAQEISDAKEAIKNEMVDVALEASSYLLKRELNSEDNKRLVDEFIEEIK